MASERRNKDGLTKSDRKRILDRFVRKEANIVFCGKKKAGLIAYYNEQPIMNPKVSAEYLTKTDVERAIKSHQEKMPKNETKEEKRFRMMVACSGYGKQEGLNIPEAEKGKLKDEYDKMDFEHRRKPDYSPRSDFMKWIQKIEKTKQVNRTEANINKLKALKDKMGNNR